MSRSASGSAYSARSKFVITSTQRAKTTWLGRASGAQRLRELARLVRATARRRAASHSRSAASLPIRIAIPSVVVRWQSRSSQGSVGSCPALKTPCPSSCSIVSIQHGVVDDVAEHADVALAIDVEAERVLALAVARVEVAAARGSAAVSRPSPSKVRRVSSTRSRPAKTWSSSTPPSTGTSWKNGSA